MRIDVEISGDAGADLAAFADRLADVSPVWPSIAREILAANREHFATAGGGRWELSPRYAAEKARRGEAIGRVTDELFESLTQTARDATARRDERPHELTIGTRSRQAKFFGRKRELFPRLDGATVRAITGRLRRFLLEGVL